MQSRSVQRLLLPAAVGTFAAASLFSILTIAGPLDPPAGAVSATYKTLTEVEPRIPINAANTPGDADSLFKITQPGSYYLTGNITGMIGQHGIEIVSSGVTVDLNGFDLQGVAMALDGVSVTSVGLSNIAVVGGSIRNWGSQGIDLGSFTATNCRIDRVCVSENLGTGIFVANDTTITNCSAIENGGNGFGVGTNCILNNCSSARNLSSGIATSIGCAIAACSANGNSNGGIVAGNGSTIAQCTVYQNGGAGIYCGIGSTVSSSSSMGNNGDGISTSNGCMVIDCTSRANSLDGVLVGSNCTVRGNSCTDNGSGGSNAANIHATGVDTRIEGNNCAGADRGVEVDIAGNIIIKNSCAGNTIDWDIAANNIVGPILDRRAPSNAAINGFTAPDSTGTAHPNANFSY